MATDESHIAAPPDAACIESAPTHSRNLVSVVLGETLAGLLTAG